MQAFFKKIYTYILNKQQINQLQQQQLNSHIICVYYEPGNLIWYLKKYISRFKEEKTNWTVQQKLRQLSFKKQDLQQYTNNCNPKQFKKEAFKKQHAVKKQNVCVYVWEK